MNLTQTLNCLSERNLTVFTPEIHILAPLPNLTQIVSLNNNLDHICHLVSPFSLPTLFFDGSVLCTNLISEDCDQECWKFCSWGHWKPCSWECCTSCSCWRLWAWEHWKFFCSGCCVPMQLSSWDVLLGALSILLLLAL